MLLEQAGVEAAGIGDGFDQGDGTFEGVNAFVDNFSEDGEAFGGDFLGSDDDSGRAEVGGEALFDGEAGFVEGEAGYLDVLCLEIADGAVRGDAEARAIEFRAAEEREVDHVAGAEFVAVAP